VDGHRAHGRRHSHPALSMSLADGVGLIGVGLRDLAFAGMGAAILRGRPSSSGAIAAFYDRHPPFRLKV
jgi:hypothetical protein